MKFSDQIRRAIRTSGMSRYRIASEAGVSESGVSRFMAGASLTTDTLDKIAGVLGLRVEVKKKSRKRRK